MRPLVQPPGMLNCPVCESSVMRAQRDPKTRLEIDICTRCHGLWFDARELAVFLKSDVLRDRFMTRASAGESQATRDGVRAGERMCPRCDKPLKTRDYAGVSLDQCEACHGMWFDDGEVRMIVERFKRGALGGDAALLEEIRGGLGHEGEAFYLSVRDLLRKTR